MGVVSCLAFDLDGTLADSKQPIPDEIVAELERLLPQYTIAIVTGGKFEQVHYQVAQRLNHPAGLEVFSCSGATYHIYNIEGQPVHIYEHNISAADEMEIQSQIESVAKRLGYWQDITVGPAFEFRGSQVTWSACGQRAPLSIKEAFDSNGEKRRRIIAELDLPGFDARLGGTSSIDVSVSGFDKAYAINVLLKSGFSVDEIVYFGDKLTESGNDYPVTKTGVRCIGVQDWGATLKWLQSF